MLFVFRLQPIDIDCMKQLHSRVNIVPVIGKADTLTQKELRELKKKVPNPSVLLLFFNESLF